MKELLLGCGSRRDKIFKQDGYGEWDDLVTLDHNEDHRPDVVWDLRHIRLPFDDDTFDALHAYEVLEHIGRQGDADTFLGQFSEYWRILKPNGHFFATVPNWRSMWAWGDPSHTRIITDGTLVFLCQEEYKKQIGKTPMSDFRNIYRADFDLLEARYTDHSLLFALKAIKPSRWEAPVHK